MATFSSPEASQLLKHELENLERNKAQKQGLYKELQLATVTGRALVLHHAGLATLDDVTEIRCEMHKHQARSLEETLKLALKYSLNGDAESAADILSTLVTAE
jgi:hypothetical protein